jgi:hypothetical protein
MWKKRRQRKKKDPLKQDPLPQAGDSLWQELDNIVLGKALLWVVAAGIFAGFSVAEWSAWLQQKPPNPAFMTAVTVVVAIVAVVKGNSAVKRAKQLRLGARGEMAVGQRLEELRAKGYRVYHDIAKGDYNIDHVLIGPGGVFIIETKTVSKPAKGDARVTYDGQRVLVNGHEPDRNPVEQVKALADRVREILARATGQQPKTRAVVLYPGWWVDPQPKGVEVWVLNPDAFAKFLDRAPIALNAEEVNLLSSALETHVRAASGQRS